MKNTSGRIVEGEIENWHPWESFEGLSGVGRVENAELLLFNYEKRTAGVIQPGVDLLGAGGERGKKKKFPYIWAVP